MEKKPSFKEQWEMMKKEIEQAFFQHIWCRDHANLKFFCRW